MPSTVKGKTSEPATRKDGQIDPKTDSKKSLGGGGGGGGGSIKDLNQSTDSPKPSTARQRARDRRRGKVEVSPEPASPSPDTGSGRIKNLAGFWAAPKEEVKVVRKKRLEIAERKDKESGSDSETDDSEDLDEIKRAQESAPAADREDMVEIEKGRAKSIANIFQNRRESDTTPTKKSPFKLDIKSEEPTVFENEPVVLEGVVKGDDPSTRDALVVSRPGRIKDMAENFASKCSRPRSDGSSDSDNDNTTSQKNSTTKKEVIAPGKIQNVRDRWQKRQQRSSLKKRREGGGGGSDSDGDTSDSSAPTETAPPRAARSKADKAADKTKIKKLQDRWSRRQNDQEEKEEAAQVKVHTKAPLRALDTAKEYGVFENEPVVREDVVRADDEQPDIISCERTKKLRRMWTMMEKEVTKDKDAKPEETNIRIKKKEEKQEPEPEPAKSSPSKPQKGIAGRYHEATKPKEEGVDSGKTGAKEGRGKLQRAFTVATTGQQENPTGSSAANPPAPKSPSLKRYSTRKKNA